MVKAGRRCCLCGAYKGNKLEVHHIVPTEQGGADDPENGIPLCFDCHAEVGSYNKKHPRGTQFRPSELKRHRDRLFAQVAIGQLSQVVTPGDELVESPAPQLTVAELFEIRPIQSMGENIFYRFKSGEPGKIEEFFVKVHFNLWTKHSLEIINIDLSYDVRSAWPGHQKIAIDQSEDIYEELDGSFRMKERKQIAAGSVSNIFVSRNFICNFGQSDDFRTVTIDFELASPAWQGIKVLRFKGKLTPLGELQMEEICFQNDEK